MRDAHSPPLYTFLFTPQLAVLQRYSITTAQGYS
jgi:hypothetical protein